MKKLMFLFALLGGVFTLSAAELPAKSWGFGQMQGKFTSENKGVYPISMKCEEASAGKVVKTVGVWARYICRTDVEVGKTYELKVTYKLVSDGGAILALWVRDGATFTRNFAKSADFTTVSVKFTAKEKKKAVIYLNMMKAVGELVIKSVELNVVD